MEVFSEHRDLVSLPVLEGRRPIGLINRNVFLSQMSQPYRMELYGRRSCVAFMDCEPLIVDAGSDIEALTFKAVEHGEKALSHGFIVTHQDEFVGFGNGLQLMRAVAEMQAARNRQIMQSIEYASVIQQSTLRTSRDALARACPGADLVWQPRDVVGGDFYHCVSEPEGWFVAVADCTGHGVPGAFMTLIASSSLAQAVERHRACDPALLLGSVNRGVKQILGQSGTTAGEAGSDDGLDAAFIWYEPARSRLVFAGARLPLLILRPDRDEVDVFEAERRGIGYVDTPLDASWKNHVLDIPPGSLAFMTTDGLIDQIGGPRALAFGKRRVREVLLRHRDGTPTQVNQAVLQALQLWQATHHRRDDLTFFCFRT
ncbi:MAG: protein-serine/threonine phosphatase [Comamonadaceae bacterium]|nr:MAG: protein-serine/threonine phosphatase [Comamonadaceae bacterium]